jgi:hypothetical protein
MNGLVIELVGTAASFMARLEVIVPALELTLEAEFIDRYESALSKTLRLNIVLRGIF